MYDLVIKNATVVNSWGTCASDVGIKAGRISKLVGEIRTGANLELDAQGAYLLPGLIDPHVHLREPGFSDKETWRTGTAAAICAGFTTVLDMPNTKPPTIDASSLEIKRCAALNNSFCDYGFFVAAFSGNAGELADLLSNPDVVGVKLFLGSTTESLLTTPEDLVLLAEILASANVRKPIAAHAELESVLETRRSNRHATTHELQRLPAAAYEGFKLLIEAIAKRGLPLHNCHTSTLQELNLLREATRAGLDITAELTPHHLFLSLECDAPRLRAFAKMNPPLRSLSTRLALQNALIRNRAIMVGTDHAPHTKTEKLSPTPPSGIPGLDTAFRLMLLLVRAGRLSISRLVQVMSSAAAERFGLEGKGRIAEGMHADLVLLEPEPEWRHLRPLQAVELQTKCGWSPFEGWPLPKPPRFVILRGLLVAERGRLLAPPTGLPVYTKH